MILAEIARKVWEAAIADVEPRRLVRQAVVREGGILRVQDRVYDLDWVEGLYLLALGKAAPAMAEAFSERAGDRIRDGVVIALPDSKCRLRGLTVCEAPHPLPDERSLAAAEAALKLARRAGERDLVFVLISGGGSAQLCAPAAGVVFEEKVAVSRELLRRGADIFELNSVRKHLSAIKGGRLAAAAAPAAVANLVISDVPGDDLETIASGPTCWDSSSFDDARNVLDRFHLWAEAPPSVRSAVVEGRRGLRPETLKKDDPVFKKTTSHLIGTNATAVSAAGRAARPLGFKPIFLAAADRGEARDAARRYVSILQDVVSPSSRGGTPLCFIGGGELTVAVRGEGKGGRNQEFVLAALVAMEEWSSGRGQGLAGHDWLIASVGTDGIDGETDAAGAWAGPSTLAAARRLRLDPRAFLENNDSYGFFQAAGGLIMTGPTGTNVMDVRLMLLR